MSDRIDVKQELMKAKSIIAELKNKNVALRDEAESLWDILEEMKETDVKNWTHLLKKIKTDIITRPLMMSKNKVDA